MVTASKADEVETGDSRLSSDRCGVCDRKIWDRYDTVVRGEGDGMHQIAVN